MSFLNIEPNAPISPLVLSSPSTFINSSVKHGYIVEFKFMSWKLKIEYLSPIFSLNLSGE